MKKLIFRLTILLSALMLFPFQATLDGSFVVLFETGRVLDGIFGFFHLFRSANNSSRSL